MLFERFRLPLLVITAAATISVGQRTLGQETTAQQDAKAETADQFLKDAIAAEQRNDFASAMRLLEQAIAKNDKLAEAYLRRGRIYKMGVGQGRQYVDAARSDLNKALSLDPNHAEWWAERANLFEVTGEPTRAIADYNEAIRRQGDQPGWFLQRSIALAQNGQLTAADRDNRKVIELVNSQAESVDQMTAEQRQLLAFAWLNNVPVLLASDQFDEAVRFGDEAARVGEGIPNVHRNRAVAYLRRGSARHSDDDFDRALAEFDRTLTLMPNYHAARFERGTTLVALKRFREAAAEMSNALRMGGPNPQGLMQLVDCCIELGEFGVAAQWLSMARQFDPSQWAYPWKLGRVKQAQGDRQAALTSFSEARAVDPNSPDVLSDLAYAYSATGPTEKSLEAKNAFLKVIDSRIADDPENGQLIFAKASMFDRLGELDEALPLYERSVEQMPDDYRSANSLAWILATHPEPDRRDPGRAVKLARQALEQAGERNVDCLDTLAAALAADGDFDAAVDAQQRAVAGVLNREKHRFLARLAQYRAGETHTRQARRSLTMDDVALSPRVVAAHEFKAAAKPSSEAMNTREIARHYRDAVVIIKSADGVGTGMIVDPRGYILTCAHVLPRYGDCQVTFYHTAEDGEEIEHEATGEILGMDVRADLALLKINVDREVPSVSLGLQSRVEAGEDVTVIGNPGVGNQILGRTLIEGIVSNPVQKIDTRSLIQTSAPVSGGCSGGPLFNDRGHVIGVVVSQGGQAIGFAVPMSVVARFLGLDATN